MKLLAALILALGIAAAQEHEKAGKKDEHAPAQAPTAAEQPGAPAHAPTPGAADHPPAAADHGKAGGEHGSGGGDHKHAPSDLWKWANFAILAAGLGYLIGKNAGPFFDARTQQIKKDMLESAAARKEAEARAAEVDGRLANLETEIAALRAESKNEGSAEADRLTKQTVAEIAKIQARSEQEIASAGKTARMELKRYSAQLAVELAEQKIRTRMTPSTDDELVQSFVQNLK